MKLNEYIADRLKEVLTEGKWVVWTNWKEQITSLNWKQATQQVEDYNTIAALTFHVNYYIAGVSKVFDGGPLDMSDKFSFDAPPITSEEQWQERVNTFCTSAEYIIQQVGNMTEDDLNSVFVKPEYGTFLRTADVMIEHAYYHLGQVLLIRKRLDKAQ